MNPFRYGSTVSNEDFCRRPELQDTIRRHIESRQNIHIEGDRRTGKTSLVFEVCGALKKVFLLHFDFQLVKSVDDVRDRLVAGLAEASSRSGAFEKLLKALAHLKPVVGINPATGEPTLSVTTASPQPNARSIVELLEFGRNSFSAQNPVVFFDEFQDLLKIPDVGMLLASMRSSIQQHHDCAYIYSGSSRSDMASIFRDPDSPFYKSALPVPVGNIPRPDFIPFLASKFNAGRRSVSSDLIGRILDLAEDNPGDAQEVCNCLWDATGEGATLGNDDLERTLDLIFSREIKYFEQVLEAITPIQKRCLRGLAALPETGIYSTPFMEATGVWNTGSITRAVRQLEKKRIVHAMGKRFVFSSPFLKLWLLRNPNR